MEKDDMALLCIVASALLLFFLSTIINMLGGLSRPYVPSIQIILILIAACLMYLGVKNSRLDGGGHIFVILILFVSAIICSLFTGIMVYSPDLISTIRLVVAFVAFVLSFAYIVSQFKDILINDQLNFVGENSKACCAGLIIVYIVLAIFF